MAESESVFQVPCVIFFMNIPKISQLEGLYSPTFSIQKIPWKVNIEKCIDTKTSLAIYLHCRKNYFLSADVTYAASLSVKLLSWDKISPDLFVECLANVYDNSETSYGTSSLIEWDELFSKENSYVRNDTINLEITIKVADPHDERKSEMELEKVHQTCDMGCVTTLRFKVTNFQNLIAVRSPQFTIHNKAWYLTVKKTREKNSSDPKLGIYLDSVDIIELKCKAKVSIKILSSKIEATTVEKTITEDFDYFDLNVASLQDLERAENGFINNDSIRMEVQIKVGCCLTSHSPNAEQLKLKFKLECAICLQTINDNNNDISSTPCGHIFCTACIRTTIQINKMCPLCNSNATLKTLRRVYLPM